MKLKNQLEMMNIDCNPQSAFLGKHIPWLSLPIDNPCAKQIFVLVSRLFPIACTMEDPHDSDELRNEIVSICNGIHLDYLRSEKRKQSVIENGTLPPCE